MKVLLGVSIVAVAIWLGITIILRALHTVH
jgi:hypothetical protein